MGKQVLVSLEREFGSGGHKIAQAIAQEFGLKYYSRNILEEIFKGKPEHAAKMAEYEEKGSPLLTRHVRGHSSDTSETLARMEFDFIRERADAGESFVIVGRCGGMVLRDYPGLITYFVMADMYDKVIRVCDREGLSERDAMTKITRIDRMRKKFHEQYCDFKWGDSRAYDLSVNISRLGLEATKDAMVEYTRHWIDLL